MGRERQGEGEIMRQIDTREIFPNQQNLETNALYQLNHMSIICHKL